MVKTPDVPDSGGVSEVEKKPPKPSRGEWKKGERQRVRVKNLETELAEAMDLDEEKGRASEIGEGVKAIMNIQELLEKLSVLHREAADPARGYWEKERRPAYIGFLAAFLQHAARSRELLGGEKSLETALDALVPPGVRTRKALDQCADFEKGKAIIAGFIAEAQALVGRKQPERVRQPDGTLQPVTVLQPVGVIPPMVKKLAEAEHKKGEKARKKKQEILARGGALPRQYVEILEELKGFLVHDVVHNRFWSDPEFSSGKETVSALAEPVIDRIEAVVPEPGKPSGTFHIQELIEFQRNLRKLTDRMESQLQRYKKSLCKLIVDGVRSKICLLIFGSGVLVGGASVAGVPYLYKHYWGGPKDGPPPADAPSDPDASPETQLDGGISVHCDGDELVFKLPKAKVIRLWIDIDGKKQKKVEFTDVAESSWKYPIPADARPGQKIQVSVDIKGESGWVSTNRDYTEVQAK